MSRNEYWLRQLLADGALAAKVAARLATKLDKTAGPDGCWTFRGTRSEFGYGLLYIGRTDKTAASGNSPAHRIAYVLHNKCMPVGGWVLHRCDNPPCCNPAHLFAGTCADNVADMVAKKRVTVLYGEDKGRAIYTNEDALRVAALAREGKRSVDICKALNVDREFVNRVRCGYAWSAITGIKPNELRTRPLRKLAESDVVAIRQRALSTDDYEAIGRDYGVTGAAIKSIVRRRTWKHVA